MTDPYMRVAYRSPLLEGWEPEQQVAAIASEVENPDDLAVMLTNVQAQLGELDSRIGVLSRRLHTAQVDKAVTQKKAERLAELIAEVESVRQREEERYARASVEAPGSPEGNGQGLSEAPGALKTKSRSKRIALIALPTVAVVSGLALFLWPGLPMHVEWLWRSLLSAQ